MDSKRFTRRLVALGAAMFFCALVFVVTLFDAQIVNGDDYLAQSIRTNAKPETVKARAASSPTATARYSCRTARSTR